MGIRRSLRLQSRNEATLENMKQTLKKNKLPRKRKVKVKRSIKLSSDKIPRRSVRIRKRNAYYVSDEEKSVNDLQTIHIINNLKIEPCEVKLEQIDQLIEKLKIPTQETNNNETENTQTESIIDNQQNTKENTAVLSPLPEKGKEEKEANDSSQEANSTNVEIEENVAEISKERSEEQEEIAKQMMEMLNQYKIQNEIDFDEINSISNKFQEDRAIDNPWGKERMLSGYREKIINNVFFNNTNVYNFKSCFKDRASLTAAFDRHSGQVSNETYPYDINETPEAEKVKRFYRKNISDPSLHSWYQYNVVSSRRFSKQDEEEIIIKPYMDKYLVF